MKKVIEFIENSTFQFNEVKTEGEVTIGDLFERILQRTKYLNVEECKKQN